MMRMTETVKQLLIINIIIYVGTNIIGDVAYKFLIEYYPENHNFRIWQPLTSMFMHAPYNDPTGVGLSHIVFNMFGLFMFGPILEHFWGAKKFLFFYISCGIGASLFSSAIDYYHFHHGLDLLIRDGQNQAEILKTLAEGKYDTRWQTLLSAGDFNSFIRSYSSASYGASGALYGIIVAFGFTFPNAPMGFLFIPIEIKAKYFISGLIILDFILGVNGGSLFGSPTTNVGHFAHLGGALTGFIMMWYWKKNQFNKNRWN